MAIMVRFAAMPLSKNNPLEFIPKRDRAIWDGREKLVD
jgi:hypothetical protein